MSADKEYERMLAGKLYVTDRIKDVNREIPGKLLVQKINQLPADHVDEIMQLEQQVFHGVGDNVFVQPPFEVDYGSHIRVGANFYCNVNAIFLDTSWITIGNNVKIGPRVNLLTAGHPIDAAVRVSLLEFAEPIAIGDNTWLGGNVTVLPGVTIGSNSVIGAGAVVTKDIPSGVVAVGNPARVLRKIDAADRQRWAREAAEYEQARARETD
ncbi:sugar O-acetyltransferase [Lacticaseibacillus zhaodongensis]|uniref:sugar O-acetyltransferase n=1 Tax=Lacticaseibacillus zhaodongensis TaxID=2668065 RepID=UPI0012D2EAFE|nr:sugar O-acetyltransferase [Lacticaseibacillus zhaodongensis]